MRDNTKSRGENGRWGYNRWRGGSGAGDAEDVDRSQRWVGEWEVVGEWAAAGQLFRGERLVVPRELL